MFSRWLSWYFHSSFEGFASSYVVADWAAILDEDGLYELSAPSWSSFTQNVPLTPHSLFVASYQISAHFWSPSSPVIIPKRTSVSLDPNSKVHNTFHTKDLLLVRNNSNAPHHLNKVVKQYGSVDKLGGSTASSKTYPDASLSRGNRFPLQPAGVIQFHSAFPAKSLNIMRRILSSSCDYTLSIVYDASRAIRHAPQWVLFKIGFLGWPGLVDWTISFKCDCYYSFSFCSKHNYRGTNSSSWLYNGMKYSVRGCLLIITLVFVP